MLGVIVRKPAVFARVLVEHALEHAAEMRGTLEADTIGYLADRDVARIGGGEPRTRLFQPLLPDQFGKAGALEPQQERKVARAYAAAARDHRG
jgi:hypothetical protein